MHVWFTLKYFKVVFFILCLGILTFLSFETVNEFVKKNNNSIYAAFNSRIAHLEINKYQ